MNTEIKYEGSKLILPEITCACGMKHEIPDMDIYVGNGIIKDSAEFIKKRNFGANVLIIADNITYEAAGKEFEGIMKEAGFNAVLCLLDRTDELKPDESALGEILLGMDKSTDFLAAVGSGSVTDLTRYVAVNTGKPFVCIGTAASMDGYTSVVAPLLNKGLKVNKPATFPCVLICDIDIMKKAPYGLTVSGFGDVLGKYIARADWILGKIVNNEDYCPACSDLVMEALDKCISNIDGIRQRTDTGIKNLIEALVLAGITCLLIGNTRAVASNEHNMGHYWEMMKLAKMEEPPSHGKAVGVATGYAIKVFEAFLNTDLKKIDKLDIKENRKARKDREKAIIENYGERIGTAIMKDNPEDFIDWEEQERRVDAILNNIDKIKAELSFLPSYGEIIDMLRRAGAPLVASDIGIDDGLLKRALLYAKDYRTRYSVFKSADEFGILGDIIAKVLCC